MNELVRSLEEPGWKALMYPLGGLLILKSPRRGEVHYTFHFADLATQVWLELAPQQIRDTYAWLVADQIPVGIERELLST